MNENKLVNKCKNKRQANSKQKSPKKPKDLRYAIRLANGKILTR